MNDVSILTLKCPACGNLQSVSLAQMVDHLRGLGMFKRQQEPDATLVRELYAQQISLLRCEVCGQIGYGDVSSDEVDDEPWCGGRACERCRRPISAERLEVFPDARRCTECQQAGEAEDDHGDPEYCPRCGAIMQLKLRGGSGITSYAMHCPECGYR